MPTVESDPGPPPRSTPPTTQPIAPPHTASGRIPFGRADLVALGVAVAIIAASAVVGSWLEAHGRDLVLPTPPLLAFWSPHLGWGTPLVVVVLLLALRLQQRSAAIGWGRLLLVGWLLNLGWLLSLILIDGVRRGWADVLLDPNEYLHDLPRIGDLSTFLATFSDHIRIGADPALAWTTHVAGHPPLATIAFWALDRIGLSGGLWAGGLCILVGSAASTGLVVVVHELAGEAPARRLVPLAALFPGAVWIGVSADGMFAGVALGGLALLAIAVTRRRMARPARTGLAVGAGLLLGATAYLSYGLVLLGLVALVIVVAGVRRRGPGALVETALALGGALLLAAVFFAAGFDWFTGLAELKVRYDTGVAAQRPYGYFVWANLGAFLISSSPLIAVGVVRSVRAVHAARTAPGDGADLAVAALCLSGLAAALVADVSGMSKAETERIWLSFGLVTFAGLALLRGRSARWALIGSAGTAIVVNHLLDTGW